jgi:hypothetical protein
MPTRTQSTIQERPLEGHQATGRHGDRHTDPTPISLRREAAECQAQPTASAKSEPVAKRRHEAEAGVSPWLVALPETWPASTQDGPAPVQDAPDRGSYLRRRVILGTSCHVMLRRANSAKKFDLLLPQAYS